MLCCNFVMIYPNSPIRKRADFGNRIKTEMKGKKIKVIKRFLRRKWRRIQSWQRNPYREVVMGTEKQACKNCETMYRGDFCPACGQSAQTEKFTFKSVFSNVMNVWGLGSRSLPRTLFYLLARPGYMIGDYLEGRRQPYFPPVKMLFVMATIYALVGHTVSLGSEEEAASPDTVAVKTKEKEGNGKTSISIGTASVSLQENGNNEEEQLNDNQRQVFEFMGAEKNRAVILLVFHSALALAFSMLFKKSKNGKRFTLPEHFYAQMYVASQLLAVACIYSLCTWSKSGLYNFPLWWMPVIVTYDYLQLLGGKIWKLLLKIVLAITTASVLCMLFLTILLIGIYGSS